jgi:hypothetical protein
MAFADSIARAIPSTSLCSQTWSSLQNRIGQGENQLAFLNEPGLINIGVCWWHSRIQRNANYLLEFQPTKPQISDEDAMNVIKGLTHTDQVMEVPGYENLNTFSSAYERAMHEAIGQWQMAESIFQFGWIHGMGSNNVIASDLKSRMDNLYTRVNQKKVIAYATQLGPDMSHKFIASAQVFFIRSCQ